MEEKKSLKISLSTILLFLAIIVIIVMAVYIYIERINYNKQIANLEANAVNMQKSIDNLLENIDSISNTINYTDDEIQKEETIKVLVEERIDHTGMPGPNGENNWGTSRFIASDGWVYEYKYDEYDEKTSYPQEENIKVLSEELIAKAKKTDKKLTDEELNLVKEYIRNVEEEKEEIKKIESPTTYEVQVTDDIVYSSFVMYNYISGKKIPIDPNVEGGIFYESPSINKLLDIVDKYI